jgi:hypothetical protein
LRTQHGGDLILAFTGVQVPSECHQITPVTIVLKALQRCGDVTARQSITKNVKY